MSGKFYAILGLTAVLLNLGALFTAFQMQKKTLEPLLDALKPPVATSAPAPQLSSEIPHEDQPQLVLANWDSKSEEIDKLAEELQNSKAALSSQKESIQEMLATLQNEKKELQLLKTELAQQRQSINDVLTQIESGEEKNLRTLATTYMGLNPDAAAAVITQMEEGLAAKILFFMTPEAVALIFEHMSASGKPAALQRIARLSEKLRLAQSTKKP